jgi:4'-phosphopantetheinyl transferase
MRELGSGQIHLWQYPIGDPPDSRHLAHAMALLSPAEKRRCATFHFDKHRTEYLLSHAMLRLALSEYAPVKPEEWEFSSGDWGKPEIGGPSLDMPLWFNLSHTEAFAVCVVGRVPHLGVDVENMNRRVACDSLAKRFFAAPEYEYLRGLPLGLQREGFFRIWTLKEAYIKAQGKGLSIPLDSFHFRFSPETPAKVVLDVTAESTPAQWSFFEFRPCLDYRVSIGVRNTGHGGFKVQCLDAAILFNSL